MPLCLPERNCTFLHYFMLFFDHDVWCGAHLFLFYLTHYTDDFSCVSPLLTTAHHFLSSTLPSQWVGDIINQIKSSPLEVLTSTGELMESGYNLSHFLLLV